MGDLVDRVETIHLPLTLAGIAHEGCGIAATADDDRSEADLDRELSAVPMAPGQFETGSHQSADWGFEEVSKVIGVHRSAIGREENLDRNANELLGKVAKERGDCRTR